MQTRRRLGWVAVAAVLTACGDGRGAAEVEAGRTAAGVLATAETPRAAAGGPADRPSGEAPEAPAAAAAPPGGEPPPGATAPRREATEAARPSGDAAGRADEADRAAAAALIREALASGSPALAFLQGLDRLGDVDLDRAALEDVLERAAAPRGSQLDRLLRPTRRLRREGDRVTVERAEPTVLEAGERGVLALEADVAFDLAREGDAVRLDEVDGIEVGRTANATWGLNHVVFDVEGRSAALDVGPAFFSRTVKIDLSAGTEPAPVRPDRSAAGLSTVLDGIRGRRPPVGAGAPDRAPGAGPDDDDPAAGGVGAPRSR